MVRVSEAYTPFWLMSSAWVPCSITSPWSSTTILSALWIVVSRCAMTRVVRFFLARRSSSAACTTSSDLLSSAEVASSSNRIGGSLMMARAMATRCFCPPESFPPPTPTCVSKPSGCSMMKS
mmetsp:Transcript_5019/g.8363  ORF Transcript_5019/g.8363 Transcript_5019/m.8363 type:complete len:122 (-) Transcript_5019:3787-4152(-)